MTLEKGNTSYGNLILIGDRMRGGTCCRIFKFLKFEKFCMRKLFQRQNKPTYINLISQFLKYKYLLNRIFRLSRTNIHCVQIQKKQQYRLLAAILKMQMQPLRASRYELICLKSVLSISNKVTKILAKFLKNSFTDFFKDFAKIVKALFLQSKPLMPTSVIR